MKPTPRLVLPRPPSLSTFTTRAREAIQAGRMPDMSAAAAVAATVNSSTGVSSVNVIHEGGGLSRLRTDADSQSVDR